MGIIHSLHSHQKLGRPLWSGLFSLLCHPVARPRGPGERKFINKIPALLHTLVIPTQVGIHCLYYEAWAKWHPTGTYETIRSPCRGAIDSRLRGNDDVFLQGGGNRFPDSAGMTMFFLLNDIL